MTEPPHQPPSKARTSAATPSRRQVIARLWRSAERQVAEIEQRMTRLDDDQQALEREAKTLAIIAKTVRDLVAIDSEAAILSRSRLNGASPSHGKTVSRGDAGDDRGDAVRDIDGFRAELARRLDELRREGRSEDAS